MPKIIENLEKKLLEEARKQVKETGYSTMTIRSVASACGVGVGTVYNYFTSKDSLVAAFMLEDWKKCILSIQEKSNSSDQPKDVVRCIYDQLLFYSNCHRSIFQDSSAVSTFAGAFSRYHTLLRQQLAEPLRKFCTDEFCAEFIAESMLTWTMAGKDFDEIYGVIGKIFL